VGSESLALKIHRALLYGFATASAACWILPTLVGLRFEALAASVLGGTMFGFLAMSWSTMLKLLELRKEVMKRLAR